MSITDLNARRWEQQRDPDQHTPREALEAVIRDIDSGALKPDRVFARHGQ